MNYDLFNCFIDGVLDTCADIQRTEFVVSPRRVHTVGQEDIEQVVIRIHPEASACKTGMPIDGGRSQRAAGRTFAPADYRLVEPQAATAGRAFTLGEKTTGFC